MTDPNLRQYGVDGDDVPPRTVSDQQPVGVDDEPRPVGAAPSTAVPDAPSVAGEPRTPEEIRSDIEGTRAQLGGTISEIEDRVSPGKIKERQTQRLRSRWQSISERVMGTRDEATDQARETTESVRDRMRQSGEGAVDTAQERIEDTRRKVEGNPLAAGLIAFGGGLLASSLLPATEREQQAAEQLRDQVEEPVREGLQEAGQQVQEGVREQATQRAKEVGKEAMQAAARTSSETKDSAERVKDDAQQSAQGIRE